MPYHFQSLMDHICTGVNCIAHLYDLIIYGKPSDEVTDNLDKVLERCVRDNVKLHAKKSVFGTVYGVLRIHAISKQSNTLPS